MTGWHKVSTVDELNQFLRIVGGFHDGIVKEVHWVNRDHVDQALSMHPCRLSDARILVQRQWENPPAVELYVEKVWRLDLDTVDFIYGSKAGTELSSAHLGPPINLLVLDLEGSKIAFERMLWRDASEWMGAEPRFGAFAIPNWDQE